MIKGEVIYTSSLNEFGPLIAQRIIDIASINIDMTDHFFMAVSGGSTPRSVFDTLSKNKFQKSIDWSKVHVFFIDERCVQKDHEENNFKSCHDLWLKHYSEIQWHRIEGWLDPVDAAEKYEKDLKSIVKINNGLPQFDLIFMGMGEDGHIASLFPEYNFGEEHKYLVQDVYIKSIDNYRITMTLPVLNNAEKRIIGIVGEKKKKIFSDLERSDFKNYPVSKLLSSNSENIWVIN